jgi:hypothetical protein
MLSSEAPPSIYLHANAAGMLRSFNGLLEIVDVRFRSLVVNNILWPSFGSPAEAYCDASPTVQSCGWL